MNPHAFALISGLLSVNAAIAADPPSYIATVLPQIDHEGVATRPQAINDARQVAGWAGLNHILGFTWDSDGGASMLQPEFGGAADQVFANDISAGGDVAGSYTPADGSSFGAAFHLAADGTLTLLPDLDAGLIWGARGMNDKGIVVGASATVEGSVSAVYWLDGQIVDLGSLGGGASAAAVNSYGVITGVSKTADSPIDVVFRWTESEGMVALPPLVAGRPADAEDINDHGIIVGHANLNPGQNRAVYWDAQDNIHVLPHVLEDSVDAMGLAVNNAGVIVGYEMQDGFSARLWMDGKVYRLQDLVVDLNSDLVLARAVDINEQGDIIVEATSWADDEFQFLTVLLTPEEPDQITFIETFDDGSNEGNWTFGIPEIEVIQPEGGNPGWWLHSTCELKTLECLDTFYPMLQTWPVGDQSEFTGNYRERGVTSVGADLITLFYSHDGSDGPGDPDFPWHLAVMLVNDNGNPDDWTDNWAVYFVGDEETPNVGEGWKSYDFDIPSSATAMPPGWEFIALGPNAPSEPDWDDVIENVAQLMFSYLDPSMFAIIRPWEVGLDNARITYSDSEPCPLADINCDGVVDIEDLFILLANWGECTDPDDCPADLTGSGHIDAKDLFILLENWG